MDTTDLLRKLVEFPSYEPEGMRRCAEFLSNELRQMGFDVSVDKLNNVFGTKEFAGGEGAFLLTTHFDTVAPSQNWTKDPLHVSIEGERLYGLGTSDNKGGIAVILRALRDLNQCRFKKLEILFSNYEDSRVVIDGRTCAGVQYFLAANRLETKSGICVDCTVQGDRFLIELGCGGRVRFTVNTIGRQTHTANPSWRTLGHSAIYDMTKVIDALRMMPTTKMTVDGNDSYAGINVGLIEGGTAINVVPGDCKIVCERRVLPNEDWENVKKQVEGSLGGVRDTKLKVDYFESERPYLLDRADPIVTVAVSAVQKTLGYTPRFRVAAGRTDSALLDQMAGVKTVIIGPGDSFAEHTADEYVSAKRIEEFGKIISHVIAENP